MVPIAKEPLRASSHSPRVVLRTQDPIALETRRAASTRAFGRRLKVLRESRGVSVDDLAERVGLRPRTINKFERGASEPRLFVLLRVSMALEITHDALLTGLLTKNDPQVTLTHRQKEILQMLSDGRSYAQIAADLHITLETVRSHARRIRERLGASTSRELIGVCAHIQD